MAADLTDEIGIHEAGLDELLRALTGPAERAELADEQAALALFRRSATSSAGVPPGHGRVAGLGGPAGHFATRQIRKPTRWNLRLVAAAAVVLCAGMAAAAYASALPAPVQRLAHVVFQFAGVPDSQAGSGSAGSSHGAPAGHNPSAPANAAPSAAAPTAGASSPPVAAGPAVLSATADATRITAGTGVLITAQLSWPGHTVAGLTMKVLERQAQTLAWHAVGSVPTGAAGNGAVGVPVVGTNTVFRVVVAHVAVSPNVRVTVVPVVTLVLQTSSRTTTDKLTVSAPYGQTGDVVVLQVSAGGGAWTYLRQGTLTALHRATFLLSSTRLGNDKVRAFLRPTGLHAGSVSAPVAVPAA